VPPPRANALLGALRQGMIRKRDAHLCDKTMLDLLVCPSSFLAFVLIDQVIPPDLNMR
jgi:hypothetical protein